MVSQADRELINNFVNELRPYLEAVESGVQEFAQPNRDGVVVGQAVQALMMIRGAGQILMVDGLVSISSWLVESFEKIQNNPGITPAEATRRLSGIFSAMEDYLVALDRGEDADAIVLRAKTIFEAIPSFGGPLPGTGRLRPRTDLDALFGDDQSTAPTDRLGNNDAADTEELAAASSAGPNDQTAEIPEALPTVPLQRSEAATRRVTDQPARIVPVPPQPTEELPDVDPELQEIFQEEALGIIAAFGDGIRELARNPADQEAIRNLNRAAHTLKGAANMTGFPLIAQIGAAIEHLFDAQLEHNMTVSRDVLELVAVSWKMLRAMVPKLNDLSSFTSPSNSIVQRANVLRDELVQAVADAETIQIDKQRYDEPIEEPAYEPAYETAADVSDASDMPTDEIVSVDIQMPAAPYEQIQSDPYDELDPYMVEAAPTVPLNRDAVAETPVIPPPVEEEDILLEEPVPVEFDVSAADVVESGAAPTNEIGESPAIEQEQAEQVGLDGDVEEAYERYIEAVAEEATDESESTSFSSAAEEFDDALVAGEERPQSEPFWTPGTEELMRSAVATDQLIADLHDIPEFNDDIVEEMPEAEAEADEFFTPIDTDQAEIADSIEVDDGSWLEEPEGPGTDLLDFDTAPQTEPFWGKLSDSQPDTSGNLKAEELITMEPFFEPVEADASFMRSDSIDEILDYPPEAELGDEEIHEDGWPANGIETRLVDETAAELGEPDTGTSEVRDHLVGEAQPLGVTLPTDLIDTPAVVEAGIVEEVPGQASDEAGEYSYEYAFDFEIKTEPAGPEFVEPSVIEGESDDHLVETVEETVARRDVAEIVIPAFESDVAEIIASAALETPHFGFEIAEVTAESTAVEDHPLHGAPAFDANYWSELDEVLPIDVIDFSIAQTVVTFDGIDPAEDDAILAALDAARETITEEDDDLDAEEVAGEIESEPVEAAVETVEHDGDEDLVDAATEADEDALSEDSAAEEDIVIETAPRADEAEAVDQDIVVDATEVFEPVAESSSDPAGVEVEGFEPAGEPFAEPETEIEDGFVAEAAPDIETEEVQEHEPYDNVEDILEVWSGEETLLDFDAVVAGLEDDVLGELDWFEEPEPESDPDEDHLVEIPEAGVDIGAASETVDVELTAQEAEAELPAVGNEPRTPQGTGLLRTPGTGLLRGSGTSRLGQPSSDSLGFGSLDLARFMTPEGSVALSSALLDMAFAESGTADEAPGGLEGAVSYFDESGERALEIEMFETFALEAEDHLATLNRAAMQLDREPMATEPVLDIKRALHTIKGAAAAADFDPISTLAHDLEDSLATHERLGTLGDRTFVTGLFSAIEEIEGKLAQRKDELFGSSEDEQASPTLRVEISRVDSLLNTVGELVVNRSSFEERLERLEAMIEDLSTAANRLQRSSYMLEREANAEDAIGRLLRGEISSRDNGFVVSAQHEWDTLEMDRYSEFDRLIRQLAEVGADVSTVVGEIASLRGDFDTVSTRQRRLTTALQDELMGIRMVPISSLAPRLYRVVRRAAGQRGKDVGLVFEGGDTPFDKILLDTLSESLLHLLRNAVDHGIEDAGERRQLGKPEHGTIRIRAFRDGSEAVIEIIDDGAGIDHNTVIALAREKGLPVSDKMSREEALALIFVPGFSTRIEADDISGRGLGLEIVEQTVARYKGRVAVDSVPGRGTVFSLRLPVMLSVIQAFLVRAGDGDFAIPVANIDYVVDRIDQPLTQIGESIVVETAGQIIPVVDVGMKLGHSRTPVLEKETGWIMVTEIAGKRWALVVDELHGQQEIVVKPMGRFLRAMPSLMGATILGHGDVALIIDVPALLGVDSLVTRLTSVSAGTNRKSDDRTPDLKVRDDGDTRVILVVDDSLSVRRVVSRTLERHGWVAVLARDGAEALELLEQGRADVLLTDIEMPRMDGFELISTIRGRDDLRDLPIAVLTSRSGDKHRERAMGLGADEYLVKPFQERELIDVIESISRVSSRV